MAEKGPKEFSRFMRHGTRGDQVEKGGQVEIGSQVEKRRPGRKKGGQEKMAEKGPKKFSRFMRHGHQGCQVENGLKRRPGRKKEARNKNGRKRAEKIFALYAPFSYYCPCIYFLSVSAQLVLLTDYLQYFQPVLSQTPPPNSSLTSFGSSLTSHSS